jgi:mono/diheme cytochrome c family protein
MNRILALAAFAAALAGSASATSLRPPGVDAGAHLAERDCAVCHAVGRAGNSPNSAAPPFRTLAMRYNPISLERALRKISKSGHFEMPPQAISESDIAGLAAYIDDVGQAKP